MPATPIRIARRRRFARVFPPVLASVALMSSTAIVLASACWAGRPPKTAGSTKSPQDRARGAAATLGSFEFGGVSLPYLRDGRGDVVVVLPDSSESLEAWRPQIASLAERYLAVAYLRGGDPAPPAPVATDDARELRAFEALTASLTTGSVHLVGEGDGARLALRFALAYPERVRSLVLSAADPRWFTTDAELAAARTGASIRPNADTLLACRRLWRLRVPVLAISGERDWRTFGDTPPLRCIRSMREQVLRGAAMAPHAQASQDFNRAVARFLERQRMTAGEP